MTHNSHFDTKQNQNDAWWNFVRRRSSHIYQSFVVETEEDSPKEDVQPNDFPEGSKIYLLVHRVTNIFCCGVNLSNFWGRVKGIQPSGLKTWLIHKLGGEDLFPARKAFFVSALLDWIIDTGATLNHLSRMFLFEAALTYGIVLFCGLVSTIGFLRYPDIRSKMWKAAGEVGRIWKFLLYSPTFFSIVCSRLWLYKMTKAATAPTSSAGISASDHEILKKEAEEFRALTTKAFWLESVFEAKPQAILQTLFLLERMSAIQSVWDFFPLTLSAWSMYSTTNTIYDLVTLNYEDNTGIFGRLYGNSYTALSTLGPALIISSSKQWATSDLERFLGILLSFVAYYVLFELIYQLVYFLCWSVGNWLIIPKNRLFAKIYSCIVLCIFAVSVLQWSYFDLPIQTEGKRLTLNVVLGLLICINGLSCFMAMDFVEECYKLKNDRIDAAWVKLKGSRRDDDKPL